MSDDDQILLIENDGAVRTLRLNRPDVLNALNDDLLAALGKAVREAEKDKTVRCLVITGAGRGFSAGQDLADVSERYKSDSPTELGAHIRERYNPIISKIRAMEKPIIASVNGVAAGAGCSLALACDLRIAAESASFIEAFINVGLVPDSGSTFMLPRLVGVARAMELAVTGAQSRRSNQIGLVNRVVRCRTGAETIKLLGACALPPGDRVDQAGDQRRMDQRPRHSTRLWAMLQTTAGQTAITAKASRPFSKTPPGPQASDWRRRTRIRVFWSLPSPEGCFVARNNCQRPYPCVKNLPFDPRSWSLR